MVRQRLGGDSSSVPSRFMSMEEGMDFILLWASPELAERSTILSNNKKWNDVYSVLSLKVMHLAKDVFLQRYRHSAWLMDSTNICFEPAFRM